jgi:hypothetical protein
MKAPASARRIRLVSEERPRSIWFWLGCGCLGCLSLVVIAFLVIFFLGLSAARDFEAGFSDPEVRDRTVRELLGTEALPEGLYPLGGIHVPFFADAAVLSSRPQSGEPAVEAGDQLFLFFQASRWMTETIGDEGMMETSGIDVERDELIAEGEIQLPHYRFDWSSYRGELEIDQDTVEGIVASMRIECFTGPARFRLALWLTPEPPTVEGQETDFTGTPADPEALRALMAQFDPCS